MRIVLMMLTFASLAGCAALSPDQYRASDGQSLTENYRLALASQFETDKVLLGQTPPQNDPKSVLQGEKGR
jgi:hypothetical protein